MTENRTSRPRRFFQEVAAEMQKVTWPTKQEIISSTMLVLVMTVLLAIGVGIVDMGFQKILRLLMTVASGVG